ncbi:hypothetical protein EST38_g14109, partial [Candolleomyces aberdarensis]
MGCLPFFTSLSSFRTPLSDFLLFLKNIFRRKDGPNTAPSIKDVNECLGAIFFVHLIKSPNPLRVDAAVAELSLLDFREKWIQFLCRSEAPEHVLTCFRLHASMPADDSYQQNETLSNYLLAFLRFAHQFEANTGGLAAELREINLKDYSILLQALKTLLEPGHPLHRRNTLPETLLPLRLALRTEVICLFRQLPLEHSPSLHLMDFHSTEMDACLWNGVQGDIRSSHRLYVMLAACRGALQVEKNVMKVSALILGQSIAQAGLAVLDMKRTSEWAPNIPINERQMIDAQGLGVLSRLFSAMVTIWEDMAVDAINNSPFLLRSAVRGACHPSQRILEALVLGFAPTGRAFRLHAIRMLNQVPELSADLFSPTSITTISNMIVYEDEDFREDGLHILEHLVTSSNGMMSLVTTALLASAETGFNHDDEEQLLRTIAFFRTIRDDLESPFYSLISRYIPRLVEIALNSNSTHIRQRALHLAKDVWARGFATEIKSAILKAISTGWGDIWKLHKRPHILTELLEILEDDGSKDASEKPPYAFAWDHPSDLVVEIFPAVFERIVWAAIHCDRWLGETDITLLKKLSKDGRVSGMLKVDALTWLETAAVQPSSSRARRDAVLVSGIFINQLDLTNKNLLKKLVEWAATDEDDDVRRSSIGLITSICKDHYLSSEILDAVKSMTILLVNNTVIEGQARGKRALWIHLLSNMARHLSFPEVVPILLELYLKLDSDSEVWKNPHEDFLLLLGEHENDSEYIKALESALPQNLKLSFKSNWRPASKWISLLLVLSQRPRLKESFNKVLKGIANDVRDGTEAKPAPKPVEPDRFGPPAVTSGLINDTISYFDDFSRNSDWRVRFNYTQLLSSVGVSKEGERPTAPIIQILLTMTTVDLSDEVLKKLSACALLAPDDDCRFEALNIFLNLLKIEDNDRNPLPKERYRAYVETMVKEYFHDGIKDGSCKVRQSWIKLADTQIKDAEFPELAKLFDASIKDSDSDVQAETMKVLQRLLEDAKLLEPIDSILPKAIESALGLDTPFNVRLAAVNLFGRLIGCVPGHDKGDSQIISRLVDISIKDEHDDGRVAALRVLKAAYKAMDLFRFRDTIKSSVAKIITNSLKESTGSSFKAVSVVDNLTKYSNDEYRDLVSSSISQILRTILVEDNRNLGSFAERVLFDNFTASATETKLNRDVLIAIPPMIASLTVEGKAIAVRLTERFAISDDTAADFAHRLTPTLRNTSVFTRAIAIEILLKLYKKRRYSKPELIESPVAEIISLVFDDKDDIELVRIPAIRLLVAMSLVPASLETAGEGQLGLLTVTTNPVLKQITPFATKFMELLQIECLRPSVVKLLSLMSLDATVRRTITLSIAATAPGSEEHILVGHVELLAQLISDGRLGKTATDYMMVVLAPALVTRPELAPYRLMIMTGLWCRYGQRTPGNDNVPENPADQKELLDWFKFALFGQHITVREAATWRTRYGIWLPRVACK